MALNERKVLFVDDEKRVINSLKRSMMDSPFGSLYAESAAQALKILKEQKIDLVVSDMLMPKMDGYKFLNTVSVNYPDTMRFALSGTTNAENVKICLVLGIAENFLVKPWKESDLLNNIVTALTLKEDLEDHRIAKLMSNVHRFPVLPITYHEVMRAISTNRNAKTIASIIEKDAAFAADVMKVSNSAFYFHGKETTSVQMAVVFLGMRTLRSIMINISIYKSIKKGTTDPEDARFLWDHSSYCNELMFYLYKQIMKTELPEDFYSAGLLHDMGKFFLMNALPDKYMEILDILKQNPEMTWSTAEMEIMEVPHTKLGSFLLRTWNFSQKLQEVCMYHHNPLDSQLHDEIKKVMVILQLSDVLSWIILRDRNIPEISGATLEYLDLTQENIEYFLKDFINYRNKNLPELSNLI